MYAASPNIEVERTGNFPILTLELHCLYHSPVELWTMADAYTYKTLISKAKDLTFISHLQYTKKLMHITRSPLTSVL